MQHAYSDQNTWLYASAWLFATYLRMWLRVDGLHLADWLPKLHYEKLSARILNARFAWGTAIIVGIAGTLFTCVDYQVQDQAVVRGQVLYVARCASCHSVDENRTGPSTEAS